MSDATASHRLHAHLIGQPGSRDRLNTPALILDLVAFECNVARMATFAQAHGLALRPHAKSHKSADIARAQIAAGAVGLCCAKLGEAEALAAEGIDGLHLTSPVVTAPAIAATLRSNAARSRISAGVLSRSRDPACPIRCACRRWLAVWSLTAKNRTAGASGRS